MHVHVNPYVCLFYIFVPLSGLTFQPLVNETDDDQPITLDEDEA